MQPSPALIRERPMSGEVTTKLLVLMAGLIACGACASPLLFDPAVEEAGEENLVDADADSVGPAPRDADPVALPDSVVIGEDDDAAVAGAPAVVDGAAVTADPVVVAPVAPVAPAAREPLIGDPVVLDDRDRTRAVVPFFVLIPILLVALALTAWAMLTPAAALGRPALIAGLCVLAGTLLAWGLDAADLSRFEMNGSALTAWLTVGLTLIAAWLVISVLSTEREETFEDDEPAPASLRTP